MPALIGLGMAIVGVVVAIPRPQAGFLIGVGGNLIAFLAMFWMLPFFLPLPIVLGYRLAREPRAPDTDRDGRLSGLSPRAPRRARAPPRASGASGGR